jgi:hypothetical protein
MPSLPEVNPVTITAASPGVKACRIRIAMGTWNANISRDSSTSTIMKGHVNPYASRKKTNSGYFFTSEFELDLLDVRTEVVMVNFLFEPDLSTNTSSGHEKCPSLIRKVGAPAGLKSFVFSWFLLSSVVE